MKIGTKNFDFTNKTYVMGILNATPDSFSDGGKWNQTDAALRHTEQMIQEGAHIIDVGGESTRPGHLQISEQEEIDRTIPIIEKIRQNFDIPISIDTYKSTVAKAALYNRNERKLAELKAEYQIILEGLDKLEQQGVIGAFDRRTIIELSSDVIKEIAQKYENVQKGVGDMMGGALIETEARKILNQGIDLTKKNTAIKLLKMGKLTIEEIAECSELSVTEVEQLAGLQTV